MQQMVMVTTVRDQRLHTKRSRGKATLAVVTGPAGLGAGSMLPPHAMTTSPSHLRTGTIPHQHTLSLEDEIRVSGVAMIIHYHILASH